MLYFKLKKQLRHFKLDISQEIGAETLVLIGHSGCGKSTLLKMLSGLLAPDEGIIKLDDRALVDLNQGIALPPEERNIGYVFQNYALFPHLTVTNNVAYGIGHLDAEERMERVFDTLDFLGIRHLAESKPAMLSGGEQQRVALARALVTRPKLLLLDEPLSALDVSTRSHVRSELKELLQQLSIPSIVVTHDYEDARVLADRVAVMDQGLIIQSGTPKEISQYPASDFVAEFIGTNLIPFHDEKSKEPIYVSFDPWHAEIALETKNQKYEWVGEAKDMVFHGGFVRMRIAAEYPLLVDAPIELVEKQRLKLNQQVHVSVPDEYVRVVEGAVFTKRPHTKHKIDQRQKSAKRKSKGWRLVIAAAAIMLTVGFVGYGVTTNAVDTAVDVGPSKEMFSLVAANATFPYTELMEKFEEKHDDIEMRATFSGTQVLRSQLEQGVTADLFLSADLLHIEALREQGYIEQFFPVSNGHVVIVAPKGNPSEIYGLEDLARKEVKLVIGVENVPIGSYTREIFEKASSEYGDEFPEQVLSRVVSYESSTKQVLQKVGLGEAEAGIVYRSDVTPDFQQKVEIIDIPEKFNVVSTNYIAVVKATKYPELSEQFLNLLLSDEGQEVFIKHGYDPME